MTSTNARAAGHLYSSLAGDPDLAPLVDMFVDDLPERVETLLDRLQSSDLEGLRRVAHQMAGAAGSYGFPQLTMQAASVEETLRLDRSEAEIIAAVNSLVDSCRRVRRGVDGAR